MVLSAHGYSEAYHNWRGMWLTLSCNWWIFSKVELCFGVVLLTTWFSVLHSVCLKESFILCSNVFFDLFHQHLQRLYSCIKWFMAQNPFFKRCLIYCLSLWCSWQVLRGSCMSIKLKQTKNQAVLSPASLQVGNQGEGLCTITHCAVELEFEPRYT